MATYSSSQNIISKYLHSRKRCYIGLGPVNCIPIRIRIKTVFIGHKIKLILSVVKHQSPKIVDGIK